MSIATPTLPGTEPTAPTAPPDVIDTGDLSASAHILKRMSIGEWLTSTQVAADYGVSSSLLKVAVNSFTAKGVRFDKQRVPQDKGVSLMAYTLAPGQDVSEFIVPPRNNQGVGATRGERNGQAKAKTKSKAKSNGAGAKRDYSGRGALALAVFEFMSAHPGADFTADDVSEALGMERERARGVLEGMCSGAVRADYRGTVRAAPGVFRWVGLEAAAKAGYGKDNGRRAKTNGASNGAKANTNGNGARAKAKSPVHVPPDDHDDSRGPSAAASAMLGFDTHGAPPVPMLGSLVRVVGSMLDEDTGDVKLMVKNAQGTWVTDVDAVRMSEGGDEE